MASIKMLRRPRSWSPKPLLVLALMESPGTEITVQTMGAAVLLTSDASFSGSSPHSDCQGVLHESGSAHRLLASMAASRSSATRAPSAPMSSRDAGHVAAGGTVAGGTVDADDAGASADVESVAPAAVVAGTWAAEADGVEWIPFAGSAAEMWPFAGRLQVLGVPVSSGCWPNPPRCIMSPKSTSVKNATPTHSCRDMHDQPVSCAASNDADAMDNNEKRCHVRDFFPGNSPFCHQQFFFDVLEIGRL
jgi:hypothetical protein